jgi:UDP-N-acetylglucosamine 2-epimerase (non-hydrolysing)
MFRFLRVFFLLPLFYTSFLMAETASQRPVVLIVGTRPEAIKMVSLYRHLKHDGVNVVLCSTGQHAELLDNAFSSCGMEPDIRLNIMRNGQDLFHITTAVLEKTKNLFKEINPAMVVVQGDTTSAMSAALAAFYLDIPVAHVEAGLRTNKIRAPFPEEFNRRLIGMLATYHFTVTPEGSANLINEGVPTEQIHCVGNTVVDALYQTKQRIESGSIAPSADLSDLIAEVRQRQQKTLLPNVASALHKTKQQLESGAAIPSFDLKELIAKLHQTQQRILLLTVHRRESFGSSQYAIFNAIKQVLQRNPSLHVIYLRHPNPAIYNSIQQTGLYTLPNISIHEPVSYIDMVYLLNQADAVVTDSGGLQEEAVSLKKPVFVLRNETDRPEGITAGGAILVGVQHNVIVDAIENWMDGSLKMLTPTSVYGDGYAGARIAHIIKSHLAQE